MQENQKIRRSITFDSMMLIIQLECLAHLTHEPFFSHTPPPFLKRYGNRDILQSDASPFPVDHSRNQYTFMITVQGINARCPLPPAPCPLPPAPCLVWIILKCGDTVNLVSISEHILDSFQTRQLEKGRHNQRGNKVGTLRHKPRNIHISEYTITLKMADQRWSDICVVFTKILCVW